MLEVEVLPCSFSAAMEAAVIKALQAIRDDQSLAINSKADKILQILQQKGHLYEQQVHPSLLIVHDQNRSGLMVNSYDSHKTGLAALKAGWQESKLCDSYCFEISLLKSKKDVQLDAMRQLVNSAENRLAPVTGLERFRTISSSHISQFAKAVHYGMCTSELPELSQFTLEALQGQFNDVQFGKLVKNGWTWKVISSVVEDSVPWLPQLLQSALNTGHSIGQTPTEIEIALGLAFHYKQFKSMDMAIQMCEALCPFTYLPEIATYSKNFAGGEDFPILVFLQAVQKQLGSSLFLGEEFMDGLSNVDFRCRSTTFPMCRAAAICCNMSSPRSQDNISKLLFVSDLQKLKTLLKQNDSMVQAEGMLKLAWEQMHKQDPTFSDKVAVKVLAKFFIRTLLFLCNKQGKGKEKKVFSSLDEIREAFKDDVQQGSSGSSAGPAQPGDSQVVDNKVWSLQD